MLPTINSDVIKYFCVNKQKYFLMTLFYSAFRLLYEQVKNACVCGYQVISVSYLSKSSVLKKAPLELVAVNTTWQMDPVKMVSSLRHQLKREEPWILDKMRKILLGLG